jgi:hypothetical protein
MLSGRRASGELQIAASKNRRYPNSPLGVRRSEGEFYRTAVKKHQAERAAKGFDCWTQFVAMLFCQLGHADSLREICNGLTCCLGKLVHLGIANTRSVGRSNCSSKR